MSSNSSNDELQNLNCKIENNGKITEYINQGIYLGKGGFGYVYKFKELLSGDFIAGKILKKEIYIKKRELLQKEIELQKSFNRPDIVKIINYKEEENYIFIFLELCENGSLQDLIERRGNLTEIEVQNYMLQIIIALNHLHSKCILHRDLKLGNLLLGKNMELKIGDFGLAINVNKEKKVNGIEGTIGYQPPEMLKGQEYSFAADIWALGIIMCYLLTGEKPFGNNIKDIKDLSENVINNPPSIKKEISKAAKDLIFQILEKDPEKRPTLNQIIYHEFFNREGVPKYLPISTLVKPIEDFSYEILNKEETFTELISEVTPLINPDIKYDSIEGINEMKINNVKDINIYILHYLNYYERFGVGYILNNGDIGVYYKDNTKILLDQNSNILTYINRLEEFLNFSRENYPDKLKNKIKILNSFIKYFEINVDNLNEIKSKKKEDNIYVKDVAVDQKCLSLKLSNENIHAVFPDKIEVIISTKENLFTYIDKRKNKKVNMILNEALQNPCRKLIKRIDYIRYVNRQNIIQKMTKNIKHVQ